jgi:hypothetical protein
MKRALHIGAAALVILALVVPLSQVSAQGLTYSSAFQLQNLSGNEADITITFYNQDGSVATTVDDAIPADGSKTYFATTVSGLPDSFSGSAVVSSSEDIRAIHNLTANNYTFGASSAGYTSGETLLNAPLIMRGNSGYHTWFNVQNAGSSDATVQVTFKAGSAGSDYTPAAVTIKPGAAYTFDQSEMSQLGDRFVGSAIIESTNDVPIVASVVEVGPNTLFAYDAFSMGDPTAFAPLFMFNNSGYISGFQIQNIDTANSSQVTVTYTPSQAGVACTETQTIEPGKSATFGLDAFTKPGQNCFTENGTDRFIGSASVTGNSAGVNLVGILNQLNSAAAKGSAYSTFLPSDAQQCVSLPLLMAKNSGYYTGFSIVNVGSATTINTDYVNTTTGDESNVPIGAGEALVRSTDEAFASKYIGGGTVCGANATDQLLVVVNELSTSGSGDTFYTYNGFGYAP